VDCVVHGGDVLYRSKVPAALVEMAFRPLKRLADDGIQVYVVPGNHERSAIPHGWLAHHSGIFVFDRPRTYRLCVGGLRLAFAGFPFVRSGIRGRFSAVVRETGWQEVEADATFLCMHQAVDGATVGPWNYTFRYGEDVVRASDIPRDFAAVLSGHIHRFQVLNEDAWGRSKPVPVFYPGSIERTSFAEKDEEKGYLMLEVAAGAVRSWRFHPLPTRPMVRVDLRTDGMSPADLRSSIERMLARLPDDAVVRVNLLGDLPEASRAVIAASALRVLAPATMNITVR
jgi:DNA repair exonuclease SbcCD nuclease subunit